MQEAIKLDQKTLEEGTTLYLIDLQYSFIGNGILGGGKELHEGSKFEVKLKELTEKKDGSLNVTRLVYTLDDHDFPGSLDQRHLTTRNELDSGDEPYKIFRDPNLSVDEVKDAMKRDSAKRG